jgi:DnaK suppressor protein
MSRTEGTVVVAKQRSTAKPAKKTPPAKVIAAKPASPRLGSAKIKAKRAAAPKAIEVAAKSRGTIKVSASKPAPGRSNGSNGTVSSEVVVGRNGTGRFTEQGERLRKTNLSPEELEEFRLLLAEKRGELIGDMNHMRSEALGHGSSGSSSSMPIHMADIGSDTWEQELTLGLIEKERGLLREIEDALARIEDRTYGICLATNKPITKARLRAKPWAKYCIDFERKRELGRR